MSQTKRQSFGAPLRSIIARSRRPLLHSTCTGAIGFDGLVLSLGGEVAGPIQWSRGLVVGAGGLKLIIEDAEVHLGIIYLW